MSETFSAGSAAFDIFAKRSKGGVLTGAAIAYVIVAAAIFAGFAALMWGPLTTAIAAYGEMLAATMAGKPMDPTDPRFAAIMQAYIGIAPAYFVVIFLVYLSLAAFEAAVHRWLVRGETGAGFLGLNLGADTWRVYFSYWMWFLVVAGLYLALVLSVVVLVMVLGFAGGAAGLNEMVVGLIGAVAGLACFCLFIYVLVRLAPANAVSVGRRRFAFFDAWKVSKGRFWSILGAYLIVFVSYLIAAAIWSGVMFSVALGPIVGSLANGAAPDPSALMASFANPTTMAVIGVAYGALLIVGVIVFLAMMGINARAVRVAIAEGRIEAPA